MMSDLVISEIREVSNGRIAILKLNRPDQQNPLDAKTIAALNVALDAVLGDGTVRAVILTGEGRAFSAGGDMNGYLDLYLNEPEFRRFLELIKTCFDKIENSHLLSIAAINGTCVAGGFEMALACDMIVMSSTARMGDAHLQYWQLPGGGGTQRLPRAIGFQAAKQLFYSYELLDARRCYEIGLVGAVYEPHELIDKALELANRTITTRPETFAVLKRLLKAAAEKPLAEGIAFEIDEVVAHAVGEDATGFKGLARFAARDGAAASHNTSSG
jgi:enoyl-CoA hydratase/carnithine racemase